MCRHIQPPSGFLIKMENKWNIIWQRRQIGKKQHFYEIKNAVETPRNKLYAYTVLSFCFFATKAHSNFFHTEINENERINEWQTKRMEKKEKTDEIIVDLFRLFHCMFLTVFFFLFILVST